MKSLNSDYCLRIFEIHETSKSIYLIVEILKGGDLINKIK